MSKADVLELAEQILKERQQGATDSPRYIQRPVSNPRPMVGPLSENYDPSKDDDGGEQTNDLYQEIPYEGLYLKPREDEYLDSSALNTPELNQHRSELKKNDEDNDKDLKKMKSEYEVEDEYS